MIDIVSAILAKKAEKIKRYPCHVNRASSLGYFVPELEGCLRRGVYERTNWKDKELYEPKLQLIFDEGRNQEAVVLRDLAEAGIEIIEQQTPYEWPEYQITGHIDGKIIDEGEAIPGEIKSMSPNVFSGINSFDDFKKKPWTRVYMAQITIYMLMQNCGRAIFILKNKSTGEIKQVNCELDYELGECCIRAAEEINKHVASGTLPDRIDNREKCKECPFKTLCLPEIDFGKELRIVDDPDYENTVVKYFKLKEYHDDCKAAYEIIKGRAKATAQADGGECNVIVGNYRVSGKVDSRGAFRTSIEAIV